jgi:pyruvate dehydrogenase E2 component (dihydrolipoamide acetyltransferase)
MPQLGETVAEGKIVRWFKSAGDSVKPGDNLFEIETDKTSMEVPSTFAGTLADIRFQVGEVAKVGAVVAVIVGTGEPEAAGAQAAPQTPVIPAHAGIQGRKVEAPSEELGFQLRGSEGAGAAQRATIPFAARDPFRVVMTPERNYGAARLSGGAVATPLARRLAGERGIDLSRVSGSGPHGRVVARDIDSPVPAVPVVRAVQVKALYAGIPFEEIPVDVMRATIARRLTEAAQTIPHFHLTADLDIDRLVTLRHEANAAAPKGRDDEPAFRLSLNDFIVRFWAAALQRVPAANAVWAGDSILRFRHSDIGVAVALDGGLITPVLRQVETKTITTISAEMRNLAVRARDRKLSPPEYQGGASTVSNLGMYGVREFSAIINPPQATILAVGAARRVPIERETGGFRFVTQIAVTLSCDHRVVDGALGAELLGVFRSFVEKPVTALI